MSNSITASYNPTCMKSALASIEEVYNNETSPLGTGYLIEAENLYNQFLSEISRKRICCLDSPYRLKSTDWSTYEATTNGNISTDITQMKQSLINIRDAFIQINDLIVNNDTYQVADQSTGMYSSTIVLSDLGYTGQEAGGIWGFLQKLGQFFASLIATFVDTVISLLLGLVQLLEGVVDAVAMLVGSVANVLGFTEFASGVRDFIAKDWTNDVIGDFIYNAPFLGSFITENTWLNDSARNFLQEAGRWVGIAALSIVIPGSGTLIGAVAGGVSGFGMGAEGAFQNGAGYGESFADALIRAATDAATGAFIGRSACALKNGFPSWQTIKSGFKPNGGSRLNPTWFNRLQQGAAAVWNGGTGAVRILAVPTLKVAGTFGGAAVVDYVIANATNTVTEGAKVDALKPTRSSGGVTYRNTQGIVDDVFDTGDDAIAANNPQPTINGQYDETGQIDDPSGVDPSGITPDGGGQPGGGDLGGGQFGGGDLGGGGGNTTPDPSTSGDPGYNTTPDGNTTPDSGSPNPDSGNTGGDNVGGETPEPGDGGADDIGGGDNPEPSEGGNGDDNVGGDDQPKPSEGGNGDDNVGGDDQPKPSEGGNGDDNVGGDDQPKPSEGGNDNNNDQKPNEGGSDNNDNNPADDPSHPKVTVDNKNPGGVTLQNAGAGALGAGALGVAGGQLIGGNGYVPNGAAANANPQYAANQTDNKKDEYEEKKDKKDKYTFESMTPTVENPALDAGLLNNAPSNVTVDGPEPGLNTQGNTEAQGEQGVEPVIEPTAEQNTNESADGTSMNADKTNLNTVLGLGGISAGLGVGGVYVAQARKDAEKEQRTKEAASKLGVAGGMMAAGALADDDDEDDRKKRQDNNGNGFNQF